MHVEIIDVLFVSWLVFLGCESHQSLVVDVNSKRIATCHKSVYPQVEFEALVEQWVVDIALHDAWPVPLDFSDIPIQIHESDCDKYMPLP